jgi:phage repressor protein C with HTH and peptisase S24 domain
MDTPGKRLKWARERDGRYKTPTDAATAFGWKVSTYLGHENGDRNPSRKKAIQYAKAYKVRWEWILEGEGQPMIRHPVRPEVQGEVGAGAEIRPVDDARTGQDTDLPPGAAVDIVPVIVRGDSMYPRYFDGETLYYLPEQRPPEEMIGREAVVKLSDGRIFVKIIKKGSRRNRFNLESWNASPIENVAIEWAAPVRWRG